MGLRPRFCHRILSPPNFPKVSALFLDPLNDLLADVSHLHFSVLWLGGGYTKLEAFQGHTSILSMTYRLASYLVCLVFFVGCVFWIELRDFVSIY